VEHDAIPPAVAPRELQQCRPLTYARAVRRRLVRWIVRWLPDWLERLAKIGVFPSNPTLRLAKVAYLESVAAFNRRDFKTIRCNPADVHVFDLGVRPLGRAEVATFPKPRKSTARDPHSLTPLRNCISARVGAIASRAKGK
jgi:hypothetical protein